MIKNIVFSGGGFKGFCYIGCIKCLEEYNFLENIEIFCGTSIGSLFATLLYIKMSYKEIYDSIFSIDFKDGLNLNTESMFNFLDNYGLDDGKNYLHIIKKIISKKINVSIDEDITFIKLYNIFKKKLIINGTCVNTNTCEYFDYINTPYMSVYKAIIISSTIPIFFRPVLHNEKLYVDGGILNNFPINLFINNLEETIGFQISILFENKKIDNFIDYLIEVCLSAKYIDSEKNLSYKKYIINLFIDNISFLDVNIDLKKRNELITNGYNNTKKYIETRFRLYLD
tara:strand:- start:394 stop:1245 length:852 start_codon:yes stop_codon:yes gene_type:complete